MSPFSGVTLFVTVACVVAVAVAVPLESEVAADTANTDSPAANQSLSSRDTEDASFGLTSALETVSISSAVDAVKDTFLGKQTRCYKIILCQQIRLTYVYGEFIISKLYYLSG